MSLNLFKKKKKAPTPPAMPEALRLELEEFKDLVFEEYDKLPANTRFFTKEDIVIFESIPPHPGMVMIFASNDSEHKKVLFSMRTIKAVHDPAFYGKEKTEQQMRRHIRNLILSQGAALKGWSAQEIDNAVKNGFLPIK